MFLILLQIPISKKKHARHLISTYTPPFIKCNLTKCCRPLKIIIGTINVSTYIRIYRKQSAEGSDGGRPPDVSELGAQRHGEVVHVVAAVRLQEAGDAEQRHDGQVEGNRRPHDALKPGAAAGGGGGIVAGVFEAGRRRHVAGRLLTENKEQ